MAALVDLVQEAAKKGWSQREFPDVRLLAAGSIPQRRGTASTLLFESFLIVDELEHVQ